MSNTSNTIAPEQMTPGMYVTVLEGDKYHREVGGFLSGRATVEHEHGDVYKGAVLEYVTADLPYAVFKLLSVYDLGHGRTVTLDTRQVRFKRLSVAYVEAVLTKRFAAETCDASPAEAE